MWALRPFRGILGILKGTYRFYGESMLRKPPSLFCRSSNLWICSWAPYIFGGADYLQGQEGLVSRFIMGIGRVILWATGVINLLTKSP